MRLILLGAPGAGKGTQASFIKEKYHIPAISTGDMLRATAAHDTELGKTVRQVMEAGHLVSDDIMIKLVLERLQQPDCINGYLFDGFPRTIPQAEAMKKAAVKIDYVLEINVPDELIIERMSGRRVHPASGRIYHIRFNPPQTIGTDDITGEDLIQRDDDQAVIVKQRLAIYHHWAKKLIDYYSQWADSELLDAPKYYRISGVGTVAEVRERVFAALSA